MRSFLIHWLVTAVALAVSARIVPGIVFTSTTTLLVSALVLGLVNAIVRPVMVVLTLPITLLTLGLFYLVVNAAALGALVVSLVSYLLGRLLEPRPSKS